MRIVFLGPPGAGKGTQAARLAASLAVPHVSTGDILRAAALDAAPRGRRIKRIIESGELVPDDLMHELVRDRLADADCASGFLLDGYPRTREQAEVLDQANPPETVVLLDVGDEELVRRLTLRGRSDDAPATVRRRLAVYVEQTRPLRDFYGKRGRIAVVDGTGTADDVYGRLLAAVAERRR